jgi:hypothetical protein
MEIAALFRKKAALTAAHTCHARFSPRFYSWATSSRFPACRPTSSSPQTDSLSLLKILETCCFQLSKQALFVLVRFTDGSNFSLPNLPSNFTLPSNQSAEVDSDLYKSGRTGNFSYSFKPVRLPGNYLVDMHFADPVASGKQLSVEPGFGWELSKIVIRECSMLQSWAAWN